MLRRLVVVVVCSLLLFAIPSLAQDAPDGAKRDFDAPANKVFAAALRSIQLQKHDVQRSDLKGYAVDFHVVTTAWSWGYNMRLYVTETDSEHSRVEIGILKSGGKTLSWGSGRKEVRKILAGIDAELAAAKAGLGGD
jgi:hypothetical protein